MPRHSSLLSVSVAVLLFVITGALPGQTIAPAQAPDVQPPGNQNQVKPKATTGENVPDGQAAPADDAAAPTSGADGSETDDDAPGGPREPAVPGQTDSTGDPATKDGSPATESDSLETSDSLESEEYYELLKLFADTLDQVERNYVKSVSRRELMEAAIQGVLAKLDQYSDYIPPEELDNFRTGVENEFGGIGIRVGIKDSRLTVITPLIDTPAYRAGVLAGDQILRIGDASTEGMSLDDAIQRMKGRIGTDIDITVRHGGDGPERQVTLKRELVRMETVFGDHRTDDDRWDFMLDPERHIGYIHILSFSRHTFDDLREAIDQLRTKKAQSLILDLRFNPGGLLSTAVEVADLFLPKGVIVSTSGRNVARRVWEATESGTVDDMKIVVLVNRYSASASEIVAASLQDHGRAVVLGERTWGKGSVQNIIELEGGRSALKLTTAGYQRPSGKNIHRFEGATEQDDWGVRPNEGLEVKLSDFDTARVRNHQRDRDILLSRADREAQATEGADQNFVDPQLQAALDYLAK